MEMIDRYVYAVTKKLPEVQRKDVADELSSLIADTLDERVGENDVTDQDVEEVLLEFGNPRSLAQKYRDGKKYIVGPDLHDLYMLVLKTVLISIVTIFSGIFLIQVLLNPINIVDYFSSYIVSFITSIPISIGWITLGFGLIEYFSWGSVTRLTTSKDWKPSQLKPIPDPNKNIKRDESISGVVFYIIGLVFLAFSNEYLGVWIFQEGEFSGVVPFINEETYSQFQILIFIVFGFGIVKECLKFIYKKWTFPVVFMTFIVNLISIILLLFIITSNQFWNPNFMGELVQNGFVNIGSDSFETSRVIWEQMTFWTLIIFMVALVLDVIVGYIKFRKAK